MLLAELNRVEMTPDNSTEVDNLVRDLFGYKSWNQEQIDAGEEVRDSLGDAYASILAHVPPCPTRTRALNMLVDARMLANAAITFNGQV